MKPMFSAHAPLALTLMLFGFAAGAQAQTKAELVAKIVELEKPAVQAMAQGMAARPAQMLMQSAGQALQTSVAADKREATAKAIQEDVKKYMDEAGPIVNDKALKLAPTVIGPILEAKFNEAELKELVGILQSPVLRKYQESSGEVEKAMAEKLIADSSSIINPKVQTLQTTIGNRLGIKPAPAASKPAAAGAKPAAPAKKP